jgi:cyclase
VNTHWHEDHLAGNADYVTAFPGLTIVSTVATRDTILHKVPAMIADEVKTYPGFLTDLRKRLDAGVTPDGNPIPAFALAYNRNEASDLERAIPELASVNVVPPTLAFDKELRIDLGGRDVHLLWLGLGNTPGDAVTWVPDAQVVSTGDLVVAPTPYAFGSFIYEWPNTLRTLMRLPATAIVPGHGPVMHDWTYVSLLASMLDTLGAQMMRAVAAAPSPDSARARIDLRAFRTRFTGDDPYLQRAFDRFFVSSAVDRAFEQARTRVAP